MPGKKFYTTCSTCIQQKKITLPPVLRSLQKEIYPVELNEETIRKAREALNRMLKISK